MGPFADDFDGILPALAGNPDLRARVIALATNAPMPGKATEGGDRLSTFRELLVELVHGRISLPEAYVEVELRLPRTSSPHAASNRVFADGWGERLVRTQLSRCYAQAVLESLRDTGVEECFVPHSAAEQADSLCSLRLAGTNQSVEVLLSRLTQSYAEGQWTDELKLPHHPHCTHVPKPIDA